MHVLIGKKQILLAGLVVMLGLAVFLNWYFTKNGSPFSPEGASPAENGKPDGAAVYTGSESADAYFADMRLKRSVSQSAALEELEAVAASAGADSEQGKAAALAIALYTDRMQKQTDIESLVLSGIGSECVAVLSDNGVDVILRPEALNEQNVTAVTDVIRSVVGADCENVRISAPVSVTAAETPAAGTSEAEEGESAAADPEATVDAAAEPAAPTETIGAEG